MYVCIWVHVYVHKTTPRLYARISMLVLITLITSILELHARMLLKAILCYKHDGSVYRYRKHHQGIAIALQVPCQELVWCNCLKKALVHKFLSWLLDYDTRVWFLCMAIWGWTTLKVINEVYKLLKLVYVDMQNLLVLNEILVSWNAEEM